VLAFALAAPVAAIAAKPVAKPAARPVAVHNWLATSNRTAEGAIVIGNPAAKVKIVEYLSMTCPHCAALSGESLKPLEQNYIAKGLVSLEVRHAVRDGYDLVASLLARCQPAADYLPSMEGLFANQEGWMTQASAAKDDAGFAAKTPDEQMAFVAKAAGFDSFFAKRGMTPKRYAACMADKTGKDQLVKMADNSWDRDKIPGTPAILINGEIQQGIVHWADLDAKLKAALH
jgi:protein-disulfide isomerase